jgi:cytoskeletal protein CcmA (bactofilin family)
MFGNKSEKSTAKTTRIATLVGAGSTLRGDLEFSGGLHVEGRIVGNVHAGEGTDAMLTLSEQGVIEGEVRVPTMVLNGTVNGDVHASGRIELASRARVNGDVYYKLIEMAMGAEVNGKLVHVTEEMPVVTELKTRPRDEAVGGENA